MNSGFEAVLRSWSFEPAPLLLLALGAALYARGWRRLHRQVPHRFPVWRLSAFLAGVGAFVVAVASPLDAFSGLLLQAHMIQHLLLLMIAPPLMLLGSPWLPMLCGMPRTFVREALGPFLVWPALRKWAHRITHPVVCGLVFVGANLLWHLPPLYELALRSRPWHQFEHLCFAGAAFLFWWPVIQPWPSRPHWPRGTMIPYLLLADLQNTALAAFFSFYDRVLYPTYEAAPRLWNIPALSDQATAGAIMWVPGSLVFLIPAGVIAVQILTGRRGVRPAEFFRRSPTTPDEVPMRRSRREEAETLTQTDPPPYVGGYSGGFDLLRLPWIGAVLRWAPFRRVAQTVMFLLALLVIADGLLGPQVSSLNLAGVLPWTYWRGLLVMALLVAGNFFCMTCPFMLVRDLGRSVLPARWEWPRVLRSKWLAVTLLVAYLWAYEVFSLWNSPWWTAWIIIGYFTAALAIDGLFKGASFCKYVCPIGQFNFVQSLSSPLEVKVREVEVCGTCTTHDCLRGNPTQRGCELELFQPRKSGNMDCTFCLDCVQACPHGNVGILAVVPVGDLVRDRQRSSVGRHSNRPDLAALVWLLTFGAFINAAGMTAPVIQWQERLTAHFGFRSSLPVITVTMAVGLVIAPSLLALACGALASRLENCRRGNEADGPVQFAGPSTSSRRWLPWQRIGGSGTDVTLPSLVCDFSMALVPLGLAMWGAHFIFHLATSAPALAPALQRAASDVGLRFPGQSVWSVNTPEWIRVWLPNLQLLLLGVGVLLSLYVAWRAAERHTRPEGSGLRLFAPWAGLLTALYLAGIWILTQPMQMRGMMMSVMNN